MLSALACLYLMVNLSVETWLRFLVWLALGLVVYLGVRAAARPGRGPHRGRGRDGGRWTAMTSAEQGDAPDPYLRTRIVLRPLGSSLPLGFFAFGIGVLLVGLLDLGALPEADAHQVALELLTFSAPLELIASVLAFLARDGGAGTALGIFGATWASQGVGLLTAPPGTASPVTGAMSLGLAVVLLALATASVARQAGARRPAAAGHGPDAAVRPVRPRAAGGAAHRERRPQHGGSSPSARTAASRCCWRTPAAAPSCPRAASAGPARRWTRGCGPRRAGSPPRPASGTSSEPAPPAAPRPARAGVRESGPARAERLRRTPAQGPPG